MIGILEAIDALEERKKAAVENEGDDTVEAARMPLVASGLDIDQGELNDAARIVGLSYYSLYVEGQYSIAAGFATTWMDGLITGLLLAEMRKGEK